MKAEDLNSTDYDVAAITNYDRRMEASKRDAVFFHGIGFGASVLGTVCTFAFGCGDPATMPYFLGLPLWFTGTVLIYLAMFVIGMAHVYKSETFSLTAKDNKATGGSAQ